MLLTGHTRPKHNLIAAKLQNICLKAALNSRKTLLNKIHLLVDLQLMDPTVYFYFTFVQLLKQEILILVTAKVNS